MFMYLRDYGVFVLQLVLISLIFFYIFLQGFFSFIFKNFVLKNIIDYFVEEGSFEEEELFGMFCVLKREEMGKDKNL